MQVNLVRSVVDIVLDDSQDVATQGSLDVLAACLAPLPGSSGTSQLDVQLLAVCTQALRARRRATSSDAGAATAGDVSVARLSPVLGQLLLRAATRVSSAVGVLLRLPR